MGLPFKTLDDVNLLGKRVLLRVDINCSLNPDTKEIIDSSRIDAIVPTLKELSQSKVVLMAHQGRPGSNDFISLEPHTEILKKMGFNAKFVDDIFGDKAKEAIKNVKVGEILVLQNVRFFDGELKKASPEEVAKEPLVQELYPLFDIFVNDAFGAAHRSQASIVGFTTVLPSYAGRLEEKEIRILTNASATDQHPWTLLFGGAKVKDKVETLSKLLATGIVDQALIGGLLGQLFLIVQGKLSEEHSRPIKGFHEAVKVAKELLETYPDVIMLPEDAAVERNSKRVECSLDQVGTDPFFDIGPATTNKYVAIIRESAVVFANGPMGFFEKEPFSIGTEKILEAIAECKGITVVGGGHLGAMAQMKGIINNITHVSTGGGATIGFLTGKKLALIAALEEAAKRS